MNVLCTFESEMLPMVGPTKPSLTSGIGETLGHLGTGANFLDPSRRMPPLGVCAIGVRLFGDSASNGRPRGRGRCGLKFPGLTAQGGSMKISASSKESGSSGQNCRRAGAVAPPTGLCGVQSSKELFELVPAKSEGPFSYWLHSLSSTLTGSSRVGR